MHQRVVLLTLQTLDVPRVPEQQRLACERHRLGFIRLVAHHGFTEHPDVSAVLDLATLSAGIEPFDEMQTSYYLGRETLTIRRGRPTVMTPILRLFIWLRRNELDATQYFGIPSNRVVELGARLDLLGPCRREVHEPRTIQTVAN